MDTPEIRSVITSFFPESFVTFGKFPTVAASLLNGTCNVLMSDDYHIYGCSSLLENLSNETYTLSGFYYYRNLLTSVVRVDDNQWFDLVEGSKSAVVRATQIGLSQNPSSCSVSTKIYDDVSFFNAPSCVGNLAEVQERSFGPDIYGYSNAYTPMIDAPNFGSLKCDEGCENALESGTLKRIKERGQLNCAVFLSSIPNLTTSSLPILISEKYCRAVAVATFQGDATAVNISYIQELDYSNLPEDIDVIAGVIWEDVVGWNPKGAGQILVSLPYWWYEMYSYNGNLYYGVGKGLSLATDGTDWTFLNFIDIVTAAFVYASREGITNKNFFEMPLNHLFGDALTFMLRDVISYAGNYDDIVNEAMARSDGVAGRGWNTVIQNYNEYSPVCALKNCQFLVGDG